MPELTQEKINLKIAEFMGLDIKWFESEHMGQKIGAYMVHEKISGFDMPISILPDYCNDMNLVYQAEEKLFKVLEESKYSLGEYVGMLCTILGQSYTMINLIHATPKQRLQSILLVIDGIKLKESEKE